MTRTSNRARGPSPRVHRADTDLDLDVVGWWLMHRPWPVDFLSFVQDDVTFTGFLDEGTWVNAGHRATRRAWGAACLSRVRSHDTWVLVWSSHRVTTSMSSASRAPCAAWPTSVQVMST